GCPAAGAGAGGAGPAGGVEGHGGQRGCDDDQEGEGGGRQRAGEARDQGAALRPPTPLSITASPMSAMGTSCSRWYARAKATALSLGTPSSTRAGTAPTSSV